MERTLKRLLQHRKTRLYFDGDHWTQSPNKAKCFSSIIDAVRDCICHGLRDVDLVMRLDETDLFSTAVR